MADIQACWAKLRELAEHGSGNPRDVAGQIVRDFKTEASDADFQALKRRVEDTLIASRDAVVPWSQLDQHSRWLAVLEGARAAEE